MWLEAKIDENNQNLIDSSDYIIKISVLKNIGIDILYDKISELFNLNQINLDNEILITNIRQKDFINKALENVKKIKIQLIKKWQQILLQFSLKIF